jgi:16S rRNA (cytosine1402-N4)-methyltransferase
VNTDDGHRPEESTRTAPPSTGPHRRRPRYAGQYPRRFAEKYKEHHPEQYPDTVAEVIASGKTPAGTHRPIMVAEMLEALRPQPGETAVDCTLGYGGHAQALLERLLPGGRLLGLDADPIELPRTESRLRALGFGPEVFTAQRTNYAALPQAMAQSGLVTADCILADLGVSSMQLDDPARGFSLKFEGPLDMRMNPRHGLSAGEWLRRATPEKLASILAENSDEPRAALLGRLLAGQSMTTTAELARAIHAGLSGMGRDELELTVRRVFQALRIEVNDEFSALDGLLRHLPLCLAPGGRVAILTFHSGEDRRVKRSFEAGLRLGTYAEIAHEVVRPSPEERRANPRSTPAKLRWAERATK